MGDAMSGSPSLTVSVQRITLENTTVDRGNLYLSVDIGGTSSHTVNLFFDSPADLDAWLDHVAKQADAAFHPASET
jgi:hypothetical protein